MTINITRIIDKNADTINFAIPFRIDTATQSAEC